MKSVNLYFHVPFCKRRCSYCAFYTVRWNEQVEEGYVAGLIRDVKRYAQSLADREVKTVYFGGGTPSLIKPSNIKLIIETCRAVLNLSSKAEITMEANPDSLSYDRLVRYQDAGINRLSIGLQAWQDAILEYFARLHNRETFVHVYTMARKAGFENTNIDLIFGIPNQSLTDWEESIMAVIALGPEHISCYSLELDNNSRLGVMHKRGLLRTPDELLDRSMYRTAKKLLKAHGYRHYEISNFCKNGFESVHNSNFWEHQEFLGIGAGASSYFDNVHFHQIERADLFAQAPLDHVVERVDDADSIRYDMVILALRLTHGLELKRYQEAFVTRFEDDFAAALPELLEHKLLAVSATHAKLTAKGMNLYNYVIKSLAV